jgi:hypothetical protein
MAYGVAILMGATSTSLWSKTATVCAIAFSYCSAAISVIKFMIA